MNCQRVQQLLSLDHDGRSLGKEAGAVTAHVRDCPACRRFQEALAGFSDKVRVASEWQPAPRREIRRRALDRWLTEREARTPNRRRPSFLFWPIPAVGSHALGAAAMLFLAAALLFAWGQHGTKRVIPGHELVRGNRPRLGLPSPLPSGATHENVPSAPNEQREQRAPVDDGHGAHPEAGHGSPQRPQPPQPAKAAPQATSPTPSAPSTVPDDQFLDGRDPSLIARWSPIDGKEQGQLAKILGKLPPPADDFVRIPFPRIAASGNARAAVAAATREYRQQAKIIDPRLARQVTLQLKGVSLSDFCARLQEQTGVELRASRGVADEKVTVFVKEQTARGLMRAVGRLFGYAWVRSGEEGALRYELDQDLKSQLGDEELRSQDAHAALLAMDAQMQKFRPYLNLSFEELNKRAEQSREVRSLLFDVMYNAGWAGMQLYHRLTPAERATLASGQELVFRPDAADPNRRLPAEWTRPILQSWGNHIGSGGKLTPIADVPGFKIPQVRLRINRSELGQVSLIVRVTTRHAPPSGASYTDQAVAIGRSPSVANPDNAKANAPLQGQPPFDRLVTLRPEPSCATVRRIQRGQEKRLPYGLASAAIGDLQQPHVFSGDVWEAVHRATGLPIVADYYTRMHLLSRVTLSNKRLFEALCTVGDAMGVRWRKEGGFLLCRSTSSLWDKLKEVPNRYLRRWIADRDAHGELPLSDFLEMASMPDAQLDSAVVSEGISHCWGLHEMDLLHLGFYRWARFLSMLTPEQLRRAQSPDRLPLGDLTPEQRRAAMALQYAQYAEADRESGGTLTVPADWWSRAEFYAEYEPAGWYVWTPPERAYPEHVFNPIYGRTAAEALAVARREWAEASMKEVKPLSLGHFSAGIEFSFHP